MDNKSLDFSMLFGSAVHDVKNSVSLLLNSLNQFAESRPAASDAEADLFTVLNFEASKISSDMVQLLSLYRMQNDKLYVTAEEVFVQEFLEDEVLNFQPLFVSKGIGIEIQCESDMCWYFDQMLLKTVLRNILLNTLRYSKANICIKADIADDQLCLSVEDDGPGYPQNIISRPGNISSQVDSSTGSTGLGLHFASNVAQLHCNNGKTGYIALYNKEGAGGGVFSIHIP